MDSASATLWTNMMAKSMNEMEICGAYRREWVIVGVNKWQWWNDH